MLGVTVPVKDWKSESEKVLKNLLVAFQVQPLKKDNAKMEQEEKNTLVQGEVFYRTVACKAHSVTKPNFDMSHINPKTIDKGVGLKSAKVKDFARLLEKP